MPKEKDLYQVSLKAILRNGKGETLVLKAVDNGTYAGFYDFPGGRINRDEFNVEIMEILKREVIEEAGDIKFEIYPKPVAYGRHFVPGNLNRSVINRTSTKGDKNIIRVLYIFFAGEYKSGDILISKEHLEYKWIRLEDIALEKYFKSGILEGVKMYLKRN